jgi:SAM-dependent methyltransferase
VRSSAAVFDALAGVYDEHFAVPHRAAYDRLAWERIEAILPLGAATIVDAGCGVGRWAERLVALGHRVIGIEPAPAMAREARWRLATPSFRLIEGRMEDVDLGRPEADVVLAMGSLQYTRDPEEAVARLATWARPGGFVFALVDSLAALVIELLRAGRTGEALLRLRERRGVWRGDGGHEADLHLLDCARLEGAFAAAGLVDVRITGLLVGATALGREALTDALLADPERQLAVERELAAHSALADVGKQLLASGRRPHAT